MGTSMIHIKMNLTLDFRYGKKHLGTPNGKEELRRNSILRNDTNKKLMLKCFRNNIFHYVK